MVGSKKYIVGIDEVGRGPLAGPLTVCAVSCEAKIYSILKRNRNLPVAGLDSKKIKEVDRERFSNFLRQLTTEGKIKFSITHISNKVIDKKGLSFCIKSAIAKNIKKLELETLNSEILLDGSLKAPIEFLNQKTIIKGDEKEKIISWASILAKVSRDKLMTKLCKKYPDYNFSQHKGYATPYHREALRKVGLSVLHRQSFCRKY